jgi:hypothetical protein
MELPADASLCFLIPLALVEAPIHYGTRGCCPSEFAEINVRLM